MKPVDASQFPLSKPTEDDFHAIETALSRLLRPLSMDLNIKFIRRLRTWLMITELPKRCVLIGEGTAPQGVYFIVNGSILVGIDMSIEMQLDHILRTGDFVLPLKLFGGGKSTIEMRVAQNSRLLFMDTRRYQSMLERFPQAVMLTHLWRDLQEEQSNQRKRELKAMGAVERLRWIYKKWPDSFQVFNDEIIGAYLGLSRETVCRNKVLIHQKD